VDLVLVRLGEKVRVEINVHVVGEAVPETFVTLEQQTLQVEAEATHIPTGVDVSVAGLTVGSQIHARDVELPAGVTLVTDGDALVVNVSAATTAEEMDAELAEAEAEAGIVHEAPEAEPAEDAAEGDGDAAPAEGEKADS